MAEQSTFMAFAASLAEIGGAAAARHFRSGGTIFDKSDGGPVFDPVTAGDREAESAIRAMIEETYPDHGIVGEEHGTVRPDARYTWVLDPIDGTRGFVLGLPTWGTLVALLHNGVPIAGAMGQPIVGDLFFGTPEQSFLRHKGTETMLRTRKCPSLANAAVATTAPHFLNEAEREAYGHIEKQAAHARYGTDCYAYALLAAGFIDIVVESGLQSYDIAALIPIIEGAGGQCTSWSGGSCAEGGQVVATGDPALHEQALEMLADAAHQSV